MVTLRSDVMTPIMEGFTSLSSVAVILVMSLVVAAFAPGKAPGRCVCLACFFCFACFVVALIALTPDRARRPIGLTALSAPVRRTLESAATRYVPR